ncbi:MAG: glycosyltransferase [Gammaproteobacteria bacterium]|nr:glycosyltransferase [Gammaproteobacteria bacterium]
MDKEKPKISVITPVFNNVATVEKTINSVANQRYPHIEYIVIDGGSTDGSVEIIQKHNAAITYWCSEHDNGISDAFNKGIDAASGDIIGIINADDWYEPDALHTVAEFFPEYDIVYGKVNYWLDNKIINVKGGNHKKLLSGWRGMTLPHPSMFVKKETYERVGNFDLSYRNALDYHFVLRAAAAEARFYNTNKVIANFAAGGATSKDRKNSLQEEKRAKTEVLQMNRLLAGFQYFLKSALIHALGNVLHRLPLDRFR